MSNLDEVVVGYAKDAALHLALCRRAETLFPSVLGALEVFVSPAAPAQGAGAAHLTLSVEYQRKLRDRRKGQFWITLIAENMRSADVQEELAGILAASIVTDPQRSAPNVDEFNERRVGVARPSLSFLSSHGLDVSTLQARALAGASLRGTPRSVVMSPLSLLLQSNFQCLTMDVNVTFNNGIKGVFSASDDQLWHPRSRAAQSNLVRSWSSLRKLAPATLH